MLSNSPKHTGGKHGDARTSQSPVCVVFVIDLNVLPPFFDVQ